MPFASFSAAGEKMAGMLFSLFTQRKSLLS
jgi:hypothetical protein